MHLNELQQQWRLLDQKLDRTLALQVELAGRVAGQSARRRVHRMAFWPALDAAFCVGVLGLMATFLSGHWRDGRLAAPAVAVAIGAVALLADCVRQLQRVARLDWTGPVAEIQCSLEQLRVARIRQFKWIILLSPLVGFCGFVVGVQWLFEWLTGGRVDVLARLDPWWVASNCLLGALFVPLGQALARMLAARRGNRAWWQAMLDDISGGNLKAAALEVDRWASLQRELPPVRA